MQRPLGVGAFQFVILASLRAVQLTRGCRPRLDGVHKHTVMAQLEVSQGMVIQDLTPPQARVIVAGDALGMAVDPLAPTILAT
jgi:hypothetical protein